MLLILRIINLFPAGKLKVNGLIQDSSMSIKPEFQLFILSGAIYRIAGYKNSEGRGPTFIVGFFILLFS